MDHSRDVGNEVVAVNFNGALSWLKQRDGIGSEN